MKYTRRILCAVLAACVLLCACGAPAPQVSPLPEEGAPPLSSAAEEEPPEQPAEITFTDALGHEVVLTNPQRVAVVNGSLAHIWTLAGGSLAGYTEDALDERGINLEGAVSLGLLKSPSVEKMIEENVDFVILSALLAEHVDLYEVLTNAGIPTAYFAVETFDDYLGMLEICAEITGRRDLYEQNGLAVRSRINDAIAKGTGREAPTVLLIRAFSTGAYAKNSENNMAGAMLRDMGCLNIADRHGSLLENLSMEVIIEEDPEFIFVTTMGASTEKALESIAELLQSNPAWNGLSAVQNGRYIVLPRELFHLKPNDRWHESYEMLADILYGQ